MTLLEIAHEKRMSETDAMNAFQEVGIISDLCVWMVDIAECDLPRAKEFLRLYEP